MWLGIGLLLPWPGLMIPKVGEVDRATFNRLGSTRHADSGGGFVLGPSLVFVPCACPVLAAISAAAGNLRVDASTFFVTIFYAAGATLPLLVFAVLAQRAATGSKKVREHLPVIRRVAGAVLAVTTLAIAFGVLDPLQRAVPGYTAALENRIESNTAIANQLHALSGEKANTLAQKQAAGQGERLAPRLAKAPNSRASSLAQHTRQPAAVLAQLTGKVVLIDF
jgi:hypothetical protein